MKAVQFVFILSVFVCMYPESCGFVNQTALSMLAFLSAYDLYSGLSDVGPFVKGKMHHNKGCETGNDSK